MFICINIDIDKGICPFLNVNEKRTSIIDKSSAILDISFTNIFISLYNFEFQKTSKLNGVLIKEQRCEKSAKV